MTTQTLGQRILRLVDVAGSRRAFARIIGVRDPTVMGWENGQEPYPRNMQAIAETTGVSVQWLRDGEGDTEQQLAIFRSRVDALKLHDEGSKNSTMHEDSHGGTSDSQAERAILMAAEAMDAGTLADFIGRILRDTKAPSPDRHARARRLMAILEKKISGDMPPIRYQ